MSEGIIAGPSPRSPVKAGSPYKVYRQGFLLKSPPRSVRKKLHRYWFVLFKQKDMLAFLYFQDEDHYLERKKNEGFFRIDDCTSIDVIPEHLGRKNAFCIDTPRSKYHLVSESRYELHHWLLALHGAMEDYKNSTGQRNKKKPTKQRSQSTTSPPSGATSPHSSLNRSQPRIKPSRPAPPAPPKDKKKGNEENVPPPLNLDGGSVETSAINNDPLLQNLSSPTTNKLDDIVAGLLEQQQEQNTLEYTLTEDEDVALINGDSREETGSLSTSLPMLNDKETVTGESNSDEDNLLQHTRHLSFSGSYEFQGKRNGKKKKRPGSVKGRRSVSPPNLPPPPPPPTDHNGEHVSHFLLSNESNCDMSNFNLLETEI